ncbi:hypothetical protein [Streptomyces sp. NPDC048438]|uniref:hypothetical protein n=1 Tax=Streptomyces sp. NPDC048438 TaxID=3365551 RepID=UPI003712AE26
MSTLGWIAVPGGRVETEAAPLRVLVVPRLTRQLAGTPMEDWPRTVNAANPLVEIREPRQADRAVPATLHRDARSDTWQGFFGHGIKVTPWQPPEGYRKPAVSPTLRDHDALIATYAAAASSPGDTEVVRDELQNWRPRRPPDPATGEQPVRDPAFPTLDFHRAVSFLRDHPYVLQALGLVVRLDVPVGALPRSTEPSYSWIRVSWPDSPVTVESPWTAYEFDGTHFLPASGGDIRSGFVDLSDSDTWKVVTVDVDGGVDRLRDTAGTALDDDGGTADEPLVLPTLKSAGLLLARTDREQQLSDRSERGRSSARNGSLAGRVLGAEDLVLGYRLDVRPQDSNTWFSLQARVARYTVDDRPVGPETEVPEEGHLKPNMMVKTEDGLHTDQIVAGWTGWSLAVPRPTLDGTQPTSSPSALAAERIPYRFVAHVEVAEGSLPELRFGRAYQLRARVADIAGGGLLPDDHLAASRPTDEIPYTRWEPVPPPEVLVPEGLLVEDPREPGRFRVNHELLGPGGTLERLVVRSSPTPNGDFRPDEFEGDPAYPANDHRTFSPPATTFQLAEQHGVLSDPAEDGRDRATRAITAAPGTGLPDPAAHGAAATVMPEPAGPLRRLTDARPWAGTWPDHQPKHVKLVPADDRDDPASLNWTTPEGTPAAESSTVRISVPPGQRVKVELTSTVLQDKLDWFEIKRLVTADTDGDTDGNGVEDTDDTDDLDAGRAALKGRHPMLTPPRRLELVHAVRRPLNAPSGSLSSSRPPGSTHAVLEPHDGIFGVHTPSTAQLDIRAHWDEWGDTDTPVPTSVPLPPLAVSRGAHALAEIRPEFGDTKHRNIRCSVTAISRFRDCFAPTDDEEQFRANTVLGPVSVKSSALPPPPVIVSAVPAFLWSDEPGPEGGIVRKRSAGRLRVELGRPWYTTGEGECVAVIVLPGDEDSVLDEDRPLVSWINRDPIHSTPSPKALADPSMFAGAVAPVDVPLVETGHGVRVLPYPVFRDEGRWYADIAMPGAASSSYCPFVHLALARYQPESLDGLSLSRVVRTDMVPLLPDRALEVREEPDGLRIALTGLSRGGNRPNRVFASVERCDAPDVPGAPVDLTSLTGTPPGFPAWERVAGATVSGHTGEPLPPLTAPAGPGRLRVLVREVEDITPSFGAAVGTTRELADRTVYTAVVPLPLA